MISMLLSFSSNYLIEIMTFMLALALAMRFISFRHSKADEAYFSHFTRELTSTINEDKTRGITLEDKEDYLTSILARVNKKLPERNLRSAFATSKNRFSSKESVSLKNYVGSKHGLIGSIQGESNVFNSSVAPNFGQLTDRVMNEDENWSKVFGVIPIDGVTRLLDVLPTLFIIFGVFGTFVGISMALPEIAEIDFSNIENSGETLSNFVVNVTFSMTTSVAGIFYSIILTLLNTIFPIEATRERTFEKVENVIQILWYHIQAEADGSEAVLKKVLNVMKEISAKLEPGGHKKVS